MAQTQMTKKSGFNEASAKSQPTLVCTGYIASVTDGRESKPKDGADHGNFNIVTVVINGLGGSKNTKVYPCTRPEWFATDENNRHIFRPESLDKVEGGKALKLVYVNNIASKDGPSVLRGLAGSEKRFDEMTNMFLNDPDVQDEDKSAVAIERILDRVLVAKKGEENFEIGYVLKQQRVKTGDTDPETGKDIWINTKYYDLKEYFDVTEANKKKYRKIAEKSAAKAEEKGEPCYFKVTFDDGAPF